MAATEQAIVLLPATRDEKTAQAARGGSLSSQVEKPAAPFLKQKRLMLPPLRFRINDHRFTMLPVEGGAFDMGDESGDLWEACRPKHRVQVSGFYLAQYPVTQALWQALTGEEWEHLQFTGARRPMERVSWDDIGLFLDKLEEKTGTRFRLPTEAEWEFAARGGAYGGGHKYAGSGRLKEVAWYEMNSHGETKPAGLKCPNELGLYDMSGNVWEWCADWFDSEYYKKSPPLDPPGPDSGSHRVDRGGGWLSAPRNCRAAYRHNWLPFDRFYYLGFRLALSLQAVGGRRAGL